MEKIKKQICIIYHYPCLDGAYSVLNSYSYYRNYKSSHNLFFIPIKSTSSFTDEDITIEKLMFYDKIIILDKGLISSDIDIIKKLIVNKISINKKIKILIIDHHLTNLKLTMLNFEKEIESSNVKIIYEAGKSACGLSFKYYKDKLQNKKLNSETKLTNDNETNSITNSLTDHFSKQIEEVLYLK